MAAKLERAQQHLKLLEQLLKHLLPLVSAVSLVSSSSIQLPSTWTASQMKMCSTIIRSLIMINITNIIIIKIIATIIMIIIITIYLIRVPVRGQVRAEQV